MRVRPSFSGVWARRVLGAIVVAVIAVAPLATATPARASAPTNGLVGYWPFDEGTGPTSADLSGSGNPATLHGAAGWSTNVAPITQANPAALTSTRTGNSYASASGTNIDGLDQYTIAFWFRLDPANPAPANTTMSFVSLPGKARVYDEVGAAPEDDEILFEFDVDGVAQAVNIQPVGLGINFRDGNFHQVTATYDGNGGSLYFDGTPVSFHAAAGSVPASNGVSFSDPGQPLGGSLDDVRVYDRALNDAEVASLASFGCESVQGVPVAECNALADLYTNTNVFGSRWTHHDNWLANNQPCTWYGVLCDSDTGHVIALDLHGNGLGGALDGLLAGLDHLVVLDLHDNALTGGIPFGLGDITTLQTLDVSHNQLQDPMPSTLGNLTALQTLRVQDNKLRGPIPTQLANIANLFTLDLGYNALWTTDATLTTYLNEKQPDWASTQTVVPTNVQAVRTSPTSILVTWSPIAYTANGGGYVVVDSPSSGTFQTAGQTADKTADSFTITHLDPDQTYQVAVRTSTPAHTDTGQQNDILSDSTDPIAAPIGYFTSNYASDQGRNLYTDAVVFHRTDLAGTQHDAAMFLAFLGGIVHSQGTTAPNLGTDPGSGPIAVTSAYTPDELTSLQDAATTFSSDPATLQHTGVTLVAFLVAISHH